MIKVLIIEDDPMVAELNKRYVNQVDGFSLVGIASNTEEAITQISQTAIDLILLDVYMPGLNGIDFLKQMREQNQDIDVILITAASDIQQIQQSLRLGAIDYLIKPFEFERFQDALTKYKHNYQQLSEKRELSQDELDQLLRKSNPPRSEQLKTGTLPKGLTKNTLEKIRQIILTKRSTPFSTDEIAEETDISRVSVRKYLKFLTEIGYLDETLVYGVGRPIYQYQLNEDQLERLHPYL